MNTPSLRRLLLAHTAAAPAALPDMAERILDQFDGPVDPRQSLAGPRAWTRMAGALRGLWLRAALFSLLAALASAGNVVVGMRILAPHPDGFAGSDMALLAGLFACCSLVLVYSNLNSNRYRGWLALASECLVAHQLTRKLSDIQSQALQRIAPATLNLMLTSDARHVANFVNIAARNVLPLISASVLALPLLALFAGWAGLCGFAVMLLLVPLCAGFGKLGAHYQRKAQLSLDRLTALTGEWVGNVRLIRYLSWDTAIVRDLRAQMRRLTLVSMKQSSTNLFASSLSVSWWMLSIAVVALAARLLGVQIDLAAFFGAIWLITLLHGCLMYVPATIRFYGQAQISLERISSFLAQPDQATLFLPDQALELGLARPLRLRFEHVGFHFDPHTPILHDLCCTIELRGKTALAGPVGAGKTIFTQLLVGEHAPTSGRIMVQFDDGRSFDLWHRQVHAALRSHIALAPQEPFLFQDSLTHNITLGSSGSSGSSGSGGCAEAAMQAAYAAELAADVAALPHGMHTQLGEAGVNLSGGQRQRVNLARALYSGRAFLVLDAPTSALDPKLEECLMARLAKQHGFLLVSHNPAHLEMVDQILVLESGRLRARGSAGRRAPRRLVEQAA